MLKNIIKNQFIKKIVAVLLVMMLTMTNFIFVAVESYALYAEGVYVAETKVSTEEGETSSNTESSTSETDEVKSRIDTYLDKTILSALQQTNNVNLAISLITEEGKSYLYKNPTFVIEMPENVTLEQINSIQMSASTELEISNYYKEDNKIVIEINGEQTKYNSMESSLNPQIKIDMDVSVSDAIPSTTSYFTIKYKNENDKDVNGEIIERKEQSDTVNIYTGYGIVTELKVENYDGNNGIVEINTAQEEMKEMQINMNEESKNIKVTGTIINNYTDSISDVELSFSSILKNYNGIESNLDIKNFSCDSSNVTIDENTITIKELESKNTIEFTAEITIPENLYYNEQIDINYITTYNYNGTSYKPKTSIVLKTETKDIVGDVFISDDRTVRLEVAKLLGNGELIKNDESVKEGTTIRYIITVTNLSSQDMSNISVNMTRKNDNSKFYDYKYYGQGIFDETMYTKEEIDDESKKMDILEIKAKSDSQVQLELVVGTDTENKDLVNKIELIANDSKVIFNNQDYIETEVTKIEDSSIKAMLKYSVPQTDITSAEPSLQAGMTDYLLLDMENTSDSEIKDIQIKIDASKYSFIKDISLQSYANKEYTFENGIFTFKIDSLDANERYTENISILFDKIEVKEEVVSLNVLVSANGEEHTSNELDFKLVDKDVRTDIKIESSIENNATVENEGLVEYTVTITNTGNNDTVAYVYDSIPSTFTLEQVIVNGSEISNENNKIVNCSVEVATESTAIVKIVLKVNSDISEVSNSIKVTAGEEQKTETFTYSVTESQETPEENPIEPVGLIDEVDQNTTVIDTPSDDNGDTSNTSGETDGSSTSTDPTTDPENPSEQEDKTYSIEGVVWLDSNKNGMRDSDEELVSGVKVMLADAVSLCEYVKDEDGNLVSCTTGDDGTYKFTELQEGQYIIVFEYDSENYEPTEYSKEGIEPSVNSDVKGYIKSDGTSCALTDAIELSSNTKNIDMGLVKLPEFDLKIESYITKVVVQNSEGTSTSEFNNSKLAKVEIPSKVLSGSTVLVEYKVKVSNIGELAGNAQEIINYIPDTMKFNSELNTDWYIASDGNVYNDSLANTVINPGESKEITLVLTKTMTTSNVGTTVNTFKIAKYTNSREFADINEENNTDKSELIISIKTGDVAMYITLIILSIMITIAGVYFIKKKLL